MSLTRWTSTPLDVHQDVVVESGGQACCVLGKLISQHIHADTVMLSFSECSMLDELTSRHLCGLRLRACDAGTCFLCTRHQ